MHREQADYLHLRELGGLELLKLIITKHNFQSILMKDIVLVSLKRVLSLFRRVNYMLLLKVTLFWLMQMKFTQAHLLLNRAGVTVQSILHPKCLLK